MDKDVPDVDEIPAVTRKLLIWRCALLIKRCGGSVAHFMSDIMPTYISSV